MPAATSTVPEAARCSSGRRPFYRRLSAFAPTTTGFAQLTALSILDGLQVAGGVEHALAGCVAALVHALAAGGAGRDDAGGGEAAIPPVVRGVAAHRFVGVAAHADARDRALGAMSPRSPSIPIILGEIRFGILLLAPGRRRSRLERWFEDGVQRLQCIPWEVTTGLRWAGLLATLRAQGRAMPIKDSLIAATALSHDLAVVTLNRRDFDAAGVRIVDPLEEPDDD